MFGVSSTGSGTLNFASGNIGIEGVTGASGASGQYSYSQFSKALNDLESSLATIGAPGPINSYSFSRGVNGQLGSQQSSTYLPTQSTGGPGYSGPNVGDLTAGAQQYGIVGAVLGARGGSSVLSSISLAGGLAAAFLGTSAAAQLAAPNGGSGQNASTTNASSVFFGSANGTAAGSSGTTALGSLTSSGQVLNGAFASTVPTTQQVAAAGSGSIFSPSAGVTPSGVYNPISGLTPYVTGGAGGSAGGGIGGTGFGSIGFGQDLFPAGGSTLDAGIGTGLSGALAGYGLGTGIAGALGENSQNGGLGGALGGVAGSIIGGPVGGLVGSLAGGLLGGLFGSKATPATSPDIFDTQRYGTIISDLVGNNKANGSDFYEDAATYKAFNGQTGLAGTEELLAGGQAAFTEETGLSAAQYAQDVKMFGSSATGSGVLQAQKNIGQRDVQDTNGVTGASGIYSYTQYGQALAAIEQGIQGTGVVGPYNSYTISRSYPNYAGSTLTSAGTVTTGTGTSVVGSTPAGTTVGGTLVNSTLPNRIGDVILNQPILVGGSSETVGSLATLIAQATALQSKGILTNTGSSGYARTPGI